MLGSGKVGDLLERDPLERDPLERDPLEWDPLERDPLEWDPLKWDPLEWDPLEWGSPLVRGGVERLGVGVGVGRFAPVIPLAREIAWEMLC